MAPDDLKLMSIDEFWDFHMKIAAILARRMSIEKRRVERRLQELRASGLSNKNPLRERRPYPQVFPKYRNPARPSQTWAGRGKQPRWLNAELRSGKKIEDFLIRTADDRSARRSLQQKARSKVTSRSQRAR